MRVVMARGVLGVRCSVGQPSTFRTPEFLDSGPFWSPEFRNSVGDGWGRGRSYLLLFFMALQPDLCSASLRASDTAPSPSTPQDLGPGRASPQHRSVTAALRSGTLRRLRTRIYIVVSEKSRCVIWESPNLILLFILS